MGLPQRPRPLPLEPTPWGFLPPTTLAKVHSRLLILLKLALLLA
jgi:hypothetical protein